MSRHWMLYCWVSKYSYWHSYGIYASRSYAIKKAKEIADKGTCKQFKFERLNKYDAFEHDKVEYMDIL